MNIYRKNCVALRCVALRCVALRLPQFPFQNHQDTIYSPSLPSSQHKIQFAEYNQQLKEGVSHNRDHGRERRQFHAPSSTFPKNTAFVTSSHIKQYNTLPYTYIHTPVPMHMLVSEERKRKRKTRVSIQSSPPPTKERENRCC
jgi:hypothetical protein